MLNTIILFLFLTGCLSQQSSPINNNSGSDTVLKPDSLSSEIKEVKSFKKFVFKVDNNDPEKIGYKIYTDDASIGVKSIYPEGEYVYITDVYYANIKRININTGEIKSSKSLSPFPADKSGIWLWDIAVFNDKIYVTTDGNSIYVFSKELDLLETIPVNKGQNRIENIKQNEIEIYVDGYQLPDKDVLILLSINKKGEISTIKKQIAIEKNTNQHPQATIQGKPFNTYTKNDKDYFECEYGIIELKSPIPEIKEYSGAENFNFNSNTLVYFNSTPTEFTLYVYTW